MTRRPARGKPHKYSPDPRRVDGTCRCGMTQNHRSHQSAAWRLVNRKKNWRR